MLGLDIMNVSSSRLTVNSIAVVKSCEFRGSPDRVILSQALYEGRCNDYPAREYGQVAGSA